MNDHILLVGMMGAGKTTVGRLLAARLGYRYVDSDQEVETATGHTVAELFANGGEPAFRALETTALTDALADQRPAVISVAGGAVLDPHNRELLRLGGTVVWLRAAPATLVRRVGTGVSRPLLAGDVAGNITRLDAVRRPLYQEVAEVVVDVDDLAPRAVVDKIVASLP